MDASRQILRHPLIYNDVMTRSRKSLIRALDLGSWMVLSITVLLFVLALIEKGLTRDILLEAAVFLVSVKLVLAASKTHAMLNDIQERLNSLERTSSK